MKSRVIAALVGSVCMVALLDIVKPTTPKLFYNTSESAPVGWYHLKPDAEIKRGVLVAAFAPAEARNMAAERGYLPSHVPLIKSVWAVAGEEICSKNGRITAPNRPYITPGSRTVWGGSCRFYRAVSPSKQTKFSLFPPMCRPLGTVGISGRSPSKTLLGWSSIRANRTVREIGGVAGRGGMARTAR